MKKRVISIVLCVSMALGLLPPLTLPAAADTPAAVTYSPITTEYAILNRFNYNNTNFYAAYVKNTALYNAVSKFQGLSAETTYTRSSGTYQWTNFAWYDNNELTGYGKLASAHQLKVGVSATLKNLMHRHGSALYGADSLAYQYALLTSGYQSQTLNGYDFRSEETATERMGDMTYIPVSVSNTMNLQTGVGRTYLYCNCGDCTIGDIAVAFADTTDPTVKSVCTCNASGGANSRFKAGDPVYLKVTFSEPIRFADNNASDHSGIKAALKDNNGNALTGSLIALQDDALMFKFDNTSLSGFTSQSLTMTSVDLSALFSDCGMVLVRNGASINGQIDTGTYQGAGYTTSASLITDIAGNPLAKPSADGSAALSSAGYVDGEAPYVASISKTAQMNNADVKTALGKTDPEAGDYLDASDTYAGIGDSITYTAQFNKVVTFNGWSGNSNLFWGLKAVLNVKSGGSNVAVEAATVCVKSGGVNLKNGASQGNVTCVTFKPFTIQAGMTCDDADGKIRIIRIIPYADSTVIADLCGNNYDSTTDVASLNLNPFTLDVSGPTVQTSLSAGAKGCVPIPEETGGATVTAFCFPFRLTDASGVNGLTGSFSWVNQETGHQQEYGFWYALTAASTAPSPDDDSWCTGETGQSYSFTQVSGDLYLHIRLKDGVEYDLTDTALSMTSKDYAGNSGTTLLALDYAADWFPPTAVLSGADRAYDPVSGTGALTAHVTVGDKVGVGSIFYLWGTEGVTPAEDDPGWKPVGGFTAGDKTASVSVRQENIASSFTGTLYVKAADPAGNTSVTSVGTLTYNVSDPAHTLTYTTDKTAQAQLSVSNLAADSAAAVMVESPDSPGTYYVSVVDSSHLGDVLNNTGFGAPSCSDLYTWRKYTVSEDSGSYTFTYLGGADDCLKQIVNGSYYGELDVTVLTGHAGTAASSFDSTPGDKTDGTQDAFLYSTDAGGVTALTAAGSASTAYPVYAETVTLSAAPGLAGVYSASLTTNDTLDRSLTANNTSYPLTAVAFDPDGSADDLCSTLEGVKFDLSLSNNKMSGWGVSDVDFSNTYLSVIRRAYNTNGTYTDEQIGGNLYLDPQATQTITLPACDYPSGFYRIVLSVTAKASGTAYTFPYQGDIYVDAAKASADFGFAGVEAYVQNGSYGISEDKETYYGPVYGAKDADGNAYTQYSAGSETIYLPVNSGVSGSFDALYFTADDVEVTGRSDQSYYGERAIKAWNVTAGVGSDASKAASFWLSAVDGTDGAASRDSYYMAAFVDSADQVLGAYRKDSYGSPYLPLIKNALNTVAYQVVNANGIASEVRYAYFYPVDAAVSGTVSTNNPSGQYVEEGTLTFTPAAGQSMLDVSVYVYDNYASKRTDISDTYDLNDNTYSLALTEGGLHSYYVYTLDSAGNYTLLGRYDWSHTDSGAPAVSDKSVTADGYGNFQATVKFTDDTIMNSRAQTLSVYFDSEYMEDLGLSSDNGDSFKLTIPIKHSVASQNVFTASESNRYGICRVYAESTDDLVTVTIYGAVKYDSALADGEAVTHTLYATMEDPFGNTSDPDSAALTISASNTRPAYLSGEYREYSAGASNVSYRGLVATFNTSVMVPKSIGTNAPSAYGTVKTSELPVFGDGTHTIWFYDIFGTEWTQVITLNDVFGVYSLTVELSDSGCTSDAVTVTVTADHPDAMKFIAYDITNGGMINLNYSGGAKDAQFTLSANSKIRFDMWSSENIDVIDLFYLVNILNEAPPATLHWYFDEFMSNTLPDGATQTTGSVTVWYETSRKVTPSGGTSASYTFDYAGGVTTYTFRYTDEAGNTGSVTADLADLGLSLAAPPAPPVDTTPPDYQINLYGKYDGIYCPVGYYSSVSSTETLPQVLADAGYVQGYYFDLDVTEDSPYHILLRSGENADVSGVTYGGASDAVDGVTLSGRTIAVTKAAAFTVVIVDSAGNKSSFSLDLGTYFDSTAPTATVEKVYTGFYEVTAYIRLNDQSDAGADTGAAVLLSPEGVGTVSDSTSPYDGWYYYVFTDNKTVTFTFRDGAGNKGRTSVAVDALDTAAPRASVSWTPYYIDGSGNSNTSAPPVRLTRSDVLATVSYDKPIRTVSAEVSLYDGSSWSAWTAVTDSTYDSYFTLSSGSGAAKVAFHKGSVAVRLTAAALNGKTVTNELYLGDVIDQVPPIVTQIVSYNYRAGYSSGTPYSATITLTPGEDVYCGNLGTPGTLYAGGSDINDTVYEKGTYTYLFTDAAGNSRSVSVTVDRDMDRTPPDITVVTGDDSVTNADVSVDVSMNEAGTLTINGTNHTVAKDQVVTVTIANNGSYGVTATDEAGNRTTAAFVIGCIDKTKPNIAFLPATVSVRQDSDPSVLTALLDTGYTVWDDRSAASAISVSHDASGVDLTKVGVYAVTYTADDEAGNRGTATRFVRIYSRDELEVLLNGVKTENGGTTALDTMDITIQVTNPVGDEPYTIYMRPGIKTAGQMKWGYSIVTPDAGGGFTLPGTGFYTLYIVTQNRQTYLITIYVQP